MGRSYVDEIKHVILTRDAMEAALRVGLATGEVHVYYQPKVNALLRQVAGMEALVRWIPDGGVISPDVFIPLAEESDLIDELGSFVLKEACRQTVAWMEKGFPPLQMAVNLSVMQLTDPNLPSLVAETLRTTRMPANLLCLEITEGVMMIDPDVTFQVLGELKALGCDIAADDFGTGYSSLSYLQKFPIDTLKLDQSFVKDLNKNSNTFTIVSAVVRLAQSLGMKVVAEGVESADDERVLRSIACDEIQGYLYSKPLSAPDYEVWLESRLCVSTVLNAVAS